MRKKRCAILVMVLVGMMGTACMKENPVSEWMKEEKTSGKLPAMEPLTGKALDHPARPVLMVMVNNHPAARPQTGLDKADMVYEVLAEGEITRFSAFYHSERSGTVGPVRSVRPYYLDLAEGSRAVVAHAGGSKEAMKEIRTNKAPSLDGIHEADRWFRRENFRRPPHNLYTDLGALWEGVKARGYERSKAITSPYVFDGKGASSNGKAASQVNITYHRLYKAGYRYDESLGKYVRYSQGEKQTDRQTDQPLAMENVVVITAPHRITDRAGHRDVDWEAGGKGMLFQRGKGAPIRWKREKGWIEFLVDGKPAPLLPGKTWVNVLPEEGKLTWQ
ncbi:DUF3048 domain-containing protein [Salinithrix halophila]|uniref:DUF3048 domain-containing protein n=1 Tax=Salinithrix halophila TaxID=1485204 RepID=A0ABV8JCX5_9BACL